MRELRLELKRRAEEGSENESDIPEGLTRLVGALQNRYRDFVPVLRENGWYDGPVLRVDVSKIDFVSNVRHLIAVYEGIEQLLNGTD